MTLSLSSARLAVAGLFAVAAWRAASSPHSYSRRRSRARRTIRWSRGSTARRSARATSPSPRKSRQPASPQMAPEAKREYLVTFLADMMLVAKAAEAKKVAGRRGLQAPPRPRAHQAVDGAVPPGRGQGRRDRGRDAQGLRRGGRADEQGAEVRARHILVETKDEAKAVLAELKKGADFAELAKAKSKDPGSADGGDLGYFTKDQMVPEFAEVAFKLDKGAMSDPVKIAVRLARHQGRGQARAPAAGIRQGQGPARDLSWCASRRAR